MGSIIQKEEEPWDWETDSGPCWSGHKSCYCICIFLVFVQHYSQNPSSHHLGLVSYLNNIISFPLVHQWDPNLVNLVYVQTSHSYHRQYILRQITWCLQLTISVQHLWASWHSLALRQKLSKNRRMGVTGQENWRTNVILRQCGEHGTEQNADNKREMRAGFRDTALGHFYTKHRDHPPQRPNLDWYLTKKSNQWVSQLEF